MITPEHPICMTKLGDPYIFGIVYSMHWFAKKKIFKKSLCPENTAKNTFGKVFS